MSFYTTYGTMKANPGTSMRFTPRMLNAFDPTGHRDTSASERAAYASPKRSRDNGELDTGLCAGREGHRPGAPRCRGADAKANQKASFQHEGPQNREL